jgi:hypothetical protein
MLGGSTSVTDKSLGHKTLASLVESDEVRKRSGLPWVGTAYVSNDECFPLLSAFAPDDLGDFIESAFCNLLSEFDARKESIYADMLICARAKYKAKNLNLPKNPAELASATKIKELSLLHDGDILIGLASNTDAFFATIVLQIGDKYEVGDVYM